MGYSQDWTRRHAFAKSYFGISNFIVPTLGDGKYLSTTNDIASFEKNGFISPSINIGATHFWGHADFYISINTRSIKFENDKIENDYRLGTFTGLRIYPWATKPSNLRPYVGYKFSPFRYKQGDSPENTFRFTRVHSVFDVGIAYQLPSFYFTLEYGRVLNPSFNTYLSRNVTDSDAFPNDIFQLGVNYTIETTGTANADVNKELNNEFSKSNLNGLFFGIGPSATFPIGTSSYIENKYPFLDDKSFPVIFPDVAFGYHFTKSDIITALSFRPINQEREAYNFSQNINRNSFILEAYKFVGDYHGFVPYIGVGVGYEKIKFTEFDADIQISNLSKDFISPAVVFGWDIRPSEKGDFWVLRTNLRYYPFLTFEKDSFTLSLQHLEFNFIQFVIYPQRLARTKKITLNKR